MFIIYTIYLWETIKYYTILLMILDTLRKIQVNPNPARSAASIYSTLPCHRPP